MRALPRYEPRGLQAILTRDTDRFEFDLLFDVKAAHPIGLVPHGFRIELCSQQLIRNAPTVRDHYRPISCSRTSTPEDV